MANQTQWNNVVATFNNAIKLVEDERSQLVSAYLVQETAILNAATNLDVFDDAAYKSGLTFLRKGFSDSVQGVKPLLNACLVDFARIIQTGKVETDPTAILSRLTRYMIDNPDSLAGPPRVTSRGFTRGAWAASGGNTGTGTIYRLSVDEDGKALESDFAEVLTFRCLQDRQLGTNVGQESFEVFGQPFRDALTWYSSGYGSGLFIDVGTFNCFTGDDTSQLIQNPSFSDSSGTPGTGSFVLNGWTFTAGQTACTVSTVTLDTYRPCNVESTPGALKCTGNVTITQKLSTRRGALARARAYLSQLAVNFSRGSGTGSVTVQIGSQSWVVNSGVGGWNLLTPALDKNLYFKNFDTDDLAVTITVVLSGGTSILIDDFVWQPFYNVGGKLLWPIGGATPWKYLDGGTMTDTEVGNAKVQRWSARQYGFSWPSAPASPITSAATLSQGGGAGSSTVGTHIVAYSYVDRQGQESGLSALSTPFSTDGTHAIAVAGLPGSPPANVVTVKLYMGKAGVGAGGPFYDTGVSVAAGVTTASITVADGSLTVASVVGVTWAEPA